MEAEPLSSALLLWYSRGLGGAQVALFLADLRFRFSAALLEIPFPKCPYAFLKPQFDIVRFLIAVSLCFCLTTSFCNPSGVLYTFCFPDLLYFVSSPYIQQQRSLKLSLVKPQIQRVSCFAGRPTRALAVPCLQYSASPHLSSPFSSPHPSMPCPSHLSSRGHPRACPPAPKPAWELA